MYNYIHQSPHDLRRDDGGLRSHTYFSIHNKYRTTIGNSNNNYNNFDIPSYPTISAVLQLRYQTKDFKVPYMKNITPNERKTKANMDQNAKTENPTNFLLKAQRKKI